MMSNGQKGLGFLFVAFALCSCATEKTTWVEQARPDTPRERMLKHFAGWEPDSENPGRASTDRRSEFENLRFESSDSFRKKEFRTKAYNKGEPFRTESVTKKGFRTSRAKEGGLASRFQNKKSPYASQTYQTGRASFENEVYQTKRYRFGKKQSWDRRYAAEGKVFPTRVLSSPGEDLPVSEKEVRNWKGPLSIKQVKQMVDRHLKKKATATKGS